VAIFDWRVRHLMEKISGVERLKTIKIKANFPANREKIIRFLQKILAKIPKKRNLKANTSCKMFMNFVV